MSETDGNDYKLPKASVILSTPPNEETSYKVFNHWLDVLDDDLTDIPDNLHCRYLRRALHPNVYDLVSQYKTKDEIITALKSMYIKTPNIVNARFHLRARSQQNHENICEYLTALKKMVVDCKLKACTEQVRTEEYLRDTFIYGLKDVEIRAKILAEDVDSGGPSLEKAISIATTHSDARAQAEARASASATEVNITAATPHDKEPREQIYALTTGKSPYSPPYGVENVNPNFVKKGNTRQNQLPSTGYCNKCGHTLPHRGGPRAVCPASGHCCMNCSRMGHFAQLCMFPKTDRNFNYSSPKTPFRNFNNRFPSSYPINAAEGGHSDEKFYLDIRTLTTSDPKMVPISQLMSLNLPNEKPQLMSVSDDPLKHELIDEVVHRGKQINVANSNNNETRTLLECNILGFKFSALLDSGANNNFISFDTINLLKPHVNLIKIPRLNLKVASKRGNADPPVINYCCYLTLQIDDHTYEHVRFLITNELDDFAIILGVPYFKMHSRVTFVNDQCSNFPSFQVHVLGAMKIGPPSPFSFLHPNIRPIASKSRHYQPADQIFIHQEINRLLQEQIIEPSNSPWRAQVVVSRQRSKPRLVVDYSETINKFTYLDAFPLPNIEDLVNDYKYYKYK